jgi:exopolysaccharide biosynthesis polyprenyl glycosylphosphotransferase
MHSVRERTTGSTLTAARAPGGVSAAHPGRQANAQRQRRPAAPAGGAYGRVAVTGPIPDAPSVRRRSTIIAQLVGIDLVAAATAVVAAYLTRFALPDAGPREVDFVAAMLLPLIWICVTALNHAYDLRFVAVGGDEFRNLIRAFMHLTVLTALVSFAGKLDLARGFVMSALPLMLLLSCAGRYAARLRLHRMRRAGRALHRVLAVGSAASVVRLAASMQRDATAGLHLAGACVPHDEVDDPKARADLAEMNIDVVGTYSTVPDAVDRCRAASVAVIAGDVGTEMLRRISWALEEGEADLIVLSGLSEVVGRRVHVQSVAGLPLLRVDTPQFHGLRRVLKGMIDRTIAVLALILLSPLMLLITVLIRSTSRGPALYAQIRIGRNGRPFRMYKFRSMHIGADARRAELADRNEVVDGVLFKIHDDPRITRAGRVLRRFSLDELPQLFNVVGGSMSLVGPRPPLPIEVARYDADVRRRLLVKPGLTGLWQVSGRSDLSWEEAVRLDLHYVENWSLGLDMLLLLKTAPAVLKATGAY